MKYSAAVITISDSGSRGERVDKSGAAICSILENEGFAVEYKNIVPDDIERIKAELISCADRLGVNLIVTTGGTGFSPRDVTPEATLAVAERECRGLPEAMRAESMKITPRGCLSRAAAGIRGGSLIINLPGSEKAAKENLLSVIEALDHGLEMLTGSGSAGCAEKPHKKKAPSADEWLKEAKSAPRASGAGMFLFHNGVVRETARAEVREGAENCGSVAAMDFSYDREKTACAVAEAEKMRGVCCVRVWLNEGRLMKGDDIMYVLVGGDIRPNVIAALDFLVGKLKNECVSEKEIFSE